MEEFKLMKGQKKFQDVMEVLNVKEILQKISLAMSKDVLVCYNLIF